MPTASEELMAGVQADIVYAAAVRWLIAQTRDTRRFPLLYKENVSYGFHRNCFGMRWAGVAVAAMAGAVVVLFCGSDKSVGSMDWHFETSRITFEYALTIAIDAAMCFLWLVLLGERSVKSAAFAYAIRLLESCDLLEAVREKKIKQAKPTEAKRTSI